MFYNFRSTSCNRRASSAGAAHHYDVISGGVVVVMMFLSCFTFEQVESLPVVATTTNDSDVLHFTAVSVDNKTAAAAATIVKRSEDYGTSKPVQLFMNTKFLTGWQDGKINGTVDLDANVEANTVWQRFAVKTQVLIRNVQNCYFTCINDCGYVYSTMLPNKECLLTEYLDDSHYTFFYRKTNKHKLYLALNVEGKTRKVSLPVKQKPSAKFITLIGASLSYWDKSKPDEAACQSLAYLQSKLNYKPPKTCKSYEKKKTSPRMILTDGGGRGDTANSVDFDEEDSSVFNDVYDDETSYTSPVVNTTKLDDGDGVVVVDKKGVVVDIVSGGDIGSNSSGDGDTIIIAEPTIKEMIDEVFKSNVSSTHNSTIDSSIVTNESSSSSGSFENKDGDDYVVVDESIRVDSKIDDDKRAPPPPSFVNGETNKNFYNYDSEPSIEILLMPTKKIVTKTTTTTSVTTTKSAVGDDVKENSVIETIVENFLKKPVSSINTINTSFTFVNNYAFDQCKYVNI
ncbi:Fibroblast growth factor [Trabala vishnou gigantina nucleopolyhedrovirus]|uniref:Fibroblast growth factor n=1 Tax=Trabala vishnou gigantina nucleopolyhedrovirus TaxID=2863583 RepID=UPI002481E660|nr:Fibroblast growth factor [Trabala vishnou gigantina nucleopolyhedrovirus]QYC92668.1 Fibroblast growth factor [Trabala vishnou gigantina nucleopolyhedrovirus]